MSNNSTFTDRFTYQIDLDPDSFGNRTDAVFHHGESYPLAHGILDGVEWECRLSNCGDQKIVGKDRRGGDLLGDEEVLNYYDTDQKLWDAIDNNRVNFVNNSWWELEFFRIDESSHWRLDADLDVVNNPKDAIVAFIQLMLNESFLQELNLLLLGWNQDTVKEEGSTM